MKSRSSLIIVLHQVKIPSVAETREDIATVFGDALGSGFHLYPWGLLNSLKY